MKLFWERGKKPSILHGSVKMANFIGKIVDHYVQQKRDFRRFELEVSYITKTIFRTYR